MASELIHKSGPNLFFLCPGCQWPHRVQIEGKPSWEWNGNLDKPTITPSIKVTTREKDAGQAVCHSFVTDGNIKFLPDSTHGLTGQTVPLPAWDGKWD